jgi:hypothetical protein
MQFSQTLREVLKYEGAVAIVAQGNGLPYVVNTWQSSVILGEHSLAIPVGGMQAMEAVLKENDHLIVILASKEVEGLHGAGAGFRLEGHGVISYEGKEYDILTTRYPWARAALKIEITDEKQTT